MARLNIDTGTVGNPATGDSLRGAFTKVNTNFEEVYSLIGDGSTGLITTSVTNGDLKIQPNGTGIVEVDQLQINGDSITSIITNGSVDINGNGTGGVNIGALSFNGTSISSTDSSIININENVTVDGNLTITGTISGLLVLETSENDGSSTAIDLTKPVAILEGDSYAGVTRTYTLGDGSYTGQVIYLIKGKDGGVANSVASKESIRVTFGKSIGSGGELTVQTNLTRTIFSQYVHCITCIWRGDAWCISEQVV